MCNACFRDVYNTRLPVTTPYLPRNSPDSSSHDIENIPERTNTESLERSNKDIISEPIDNAAVLSQEVRGETIEEIERRLPADQKYKRYLINEIKTKSMPRGIKLREIRKIADAPDYSAEEQKLLTSDLFTRMGPPVREVKNRKRARDDSSVGSITPTSQSLETHERSHITPERPLTQRSPQLNPPPVYIRRDENSNRELVQLPSSPIVSSSSDSSLESNRSKSAPPKRHKTRRNTTVERDSEGSAHSNMAAPSRPHIPHHQPTVTGSSTQQQLIRPPKKTMGA